MSHPPVLVLDPAHLVGFIPTFLHEDDPRRASEQFNERHVHGGGWRPQKGFTKGDGVFSLKFPGDPPLQAIALIPFRGEVVVVYRYGYVAIYQSDGSFEVCRMD